jgi:pheromone shutdown-related protein TraB
MRTVSNIEPNLDLIEFGGRKIYLVGTAHISRQSAELAEHAIRTLSPDTVCLELCASRYESLRDPQRWKNTDIVQVIRSGRAYVLLAQLVLASFQRRLAEQFDIKPGEEMLRAIAVAEETKATICLVDREVKITLRRAWAGAGFVSAAKMMASLVGSLFGGEKIAQEEIEKMKTTDVMTAVMDEFSEYLPGVKRGLIDERDEYMASKIWASPGEKVVAVVGAGHVPGITRLLGEAIDCSRLEQIPPPGLASQLFKWGIPALLLVLLVAGFFTSGVSLTWELVRTWVLTTGTLAAAGAAIALAHPLTIAAAFLSAPVTPLHPLIAVGGVCALVEAWLRKPRVKDLETVAEDLQHWKGWWSNRVSRILLIFILANLGGTIGVFVAGTAMIANILN